MEQSTNALGDSNGLRWRQAHEDAHTKTSFEVEANDGRSVRECVAPLSKHACHGQGAMGGGSSGRWSRHKSGLWRSGGDRATGRMASRSSRRATQAAQMRGPAAVEKWGWRWAKPPFTPLRMGDRD